MTQPKRMFRTAARAALAVTLICLASGQAWADSARSWILENQSGQVHVVKTGISPIALTPGDVFGGGDWIETGADGRAVLRRGEETIVVAPNSRIGLPKDNTGPFATRVLHTLGTILLTVEKKAKQHFEVQTPYLTAVVKGTTFTVGIQDGRSVVHVVEGLVEVKNLASGRSTLVRPGQTGAVSRGGAADVQVEGGFGGTAPVDKAASPAPAASEAVTQAASAAPAVEARGNSGTVKIKQALGPKTLDLSQSTNGLMRAASRAAPHAAAGRLAATELAGKTGVTGARAKGGRALALGQSVSTGPGLALGRSVSANPGLALGRSVSANPGLGSAGGNGLALGQGASANSSPGNGNGNGNGNGKGKGNGNGNGNGNDK